MSPNQKIRFALVGAGGIAKAYADAFREHPDCELVAVVDVRLKAAQEIASTLPFCRAFDRVTAGRLPDALKSGMDGP